MMMTSLIALAQAQPPIRIAPPPAPPPVSVPRTSPPPPPPTVTPPRAIAGSITHADYPAEALREEASGTTRVRLSVTPEGTVSGCTVIASAGHAALDSTACQLLTTRFRFSPATERGRPVAGSYQTAVRWSLPDGHPPTPIGFAQARFTQTVSASPAGVADCQVTQIGSAFAAFDYGQCQDLTNVGLVDSKLMGAGHPRVRLIQTVSLLPQSETLSMPAVPGAPHWEETADLQIAPDGSVSACTMVSQTGTPPKYARPIFQPLCQELGYVIFPHVPGTAVRRARMRSAVQVEVQVGQR